MANTDLLRRTLAHIEQHPEQWDQDSWAARTPCGTSHCFAGWAVALEGGEPDFFPGMNFADYTTDPDGRFHALLNLAPEYPVLIPEVAAALLELSIEDADPLFAPENTLDDLRRIVAELTADPAADPRPHVP